MTIKGHEGYERAGPGATRVSHRGEVSTVPITKAGTQIQPGAETLVRMAAGSRGKSTGI